MSTLKETKTNILVDIGKRLGLSGDNLDAFVNETRIRLVRADEYEKELQNEAQVRIVECLNRIEEEEYGNAE